MKKVKYKQKSDWKLMLELFIEPAFMMGVFVGMLIMMTLIFIMFIL